MSESAQLPLGFSTPASEGGEEIVETLPPFDHGYFDALAAIGFAALADTYFDTPQTPLIRRTPAGFAITYRKQLRDRPQRHWLKYSVAASWQSKSWWVDGKALIKDAPFVKDSEPANTVNANQGRGGDKIKPYQALIETEGAEQSTVGDSFSLVTTADGVRKEPKPLRILYGAINKYCDGDWLNLAIYVCRHLGLELLEGSFEDDKITFNNAVLPQGSKGANSSNSYSITGSSLSVRISRALSRYTCLAVAGLVYASTGSTSAGFAVPVPGDMRLSSLHLIVRDNRARWTGTGFFFSYDNYLNYLKLLLRYNLERYALYSVAGANFIELGSAPSPAGSWQFAVPQHRYSEMSAECLQILLYRWKKATTPKVGSPPSINREAVRLLVRGFEHSDPASAAQGYLGYIADVGFSSERPFYPLYQTFFEEIMEYRYSDLLAAFRQEDVRAFVNLVRQETYSAVYHPPEQADSQPNYQMMRRLREVQSTEDLVQALVEIAIERGTSKLASAKGNRDTLKYLAMPFEPSITRLVELAEQTQNPRLIAQLVLAFALCRRENESVPQDKESGFEDSIADAA